MPVISRVLSFVPIINTPVFNVSRLIKRSFGTIPIGLNALVAKEFETYFIKKNLISVGKFYGDLSLPLKTTDRDYLGKLKHSSMSPNIVLLPSIRLEIKSLNDKGYRIEYVFSGEYKENHDGANEKGIKFYKIIAYDLIDGTRVIDKNLINEIETSNSIDKPVTGNIGNSLNRYYIRIEGGADKGIYEINSPETARFYYFFRYLETKDAVGKKTFNTTFGNISNDDSNEMNSMIKDSVQKVNPTFMNVLKESYNINTDSEYYEKNPGVFDYKIPLDDATLYNIDGTYYNTNEAGNYMWGRMLNEEDSFTVNKLVGNVLRQGGSMKNLRFDEWYDGKSYNSGVESVTEKIKSDKITNIEISNEEMLKSFLPPYVQYHYGEIWDLLDN